MENSKDRMKYRYILPSIYFEGLSVAKSGCKGTLNTLYKNRSRSKRTERVRQHLEYFQKKISIIEKDDLDRLIEQKRDLDDNSGENRNKFSDNSVIVNKNDNTLLFQQVYLRTNNKFLCIATRDRSEVSANEFKTTTKETSYKNSYAIEYDVTNNSYKTGSAVEYGIRLYMDSMATKQKIEPIAIIRVEEKKTSRYVSSIRFSQI